MILLVVIVVESAICFLANLSAPFRCCCAFKPSLDRI